MGQSGQARNGNLRITRRVGRTTCQRWSGHHRRALNPCSRRGLSPPSTQRIPRGWRGPSALWPACAAVPAYGDGRQPHSWRDRISITLTSAAGAFADLDPSESTPPDVAAPLRPGPMRAPSPSTGEAVAIRSSQKLSQAIGPSLRIVPAECLTPVGKAGQEHHHRAVPAREAAQADSDHFRCLEPRRTDLSGLGRMAIGTRERGWTAPACRIGGGALLLGGDGPGRLDRPHDRTTWAVADARAAAPGRLIPEESQMTAVMSNLTDQFLDHQDMTRHAHLRSGSPGSARP
jgi:hypothetical protein